MSSLVKFENKYIDYTTKDLIRSYLSNAKKELLKIHKACDFGDDVKILEDRNLIQVSLIGAHFKLSVRHGEQTHNTKVKLYKNGVFEREVLLQNLHNPKLIEELKKAR